MNHPQIEIPREVPHTVRMTPRDMRRELAFYLFQQGRLSFGKAREMAGMTVW
ncbi:putative antitoxin, contains HTH domain, partial [Candidatus Methanophagaceae archaeon]